MVHVSGWNIFLGLAWAENQFSELLTLKASEKVEYNYATILKVIVGQV